MLILPLHRALTRANFPWTTLGLILANAFVFFGLQSGDARVHERAIAYYVQADLAHWEFPAYRAWLAGRVDRDDRRTAFEQSVDVGEPERAARILLGDDAFTADLHAGRDGAAVDADDRADWLERRTAYEHLAQAAFTGRWMLRQSEIAPSRLFGYMFLHGGIGHLLGNMLFLAVLGLLVEGALGHGLFLLVYLLGGLGAAFASLAWHWGDAGSLVGASGAIAALMGAYCVLWGLRPVRFFWWFFVVFGYLRAPALVLLPAWLGWELLQLAFVQGSNVAFEAHAGGIVAGALLALAVRRAGFERHDFLDQDIVAEQADEDRSAYARALDHLGRLEIPAARALLERVVARRPDDLEAHVALYRCANCEPGKPQLADAARAVLVLPARLVDDVRAQKAVFDDFVAQRRRVPALPPQALMALALRWPAIGEARAAADLLVRQAPHAASIAGWPAAMLRLAHDLDARRDAASAASLLTRLVETAPTSPEAAKARLLLDLHA